MTIEYEEGSENVGVTVYARPDGFVSLQLHRYEDGESVEYLYGIVLQPHIARDIASNLTLASWRVEDQEKWRDGQRDA